MNPRTLTRPILAAALMALVPALLLGCPAPQEQAPAAEEPAPAEQQAPAAEEPMAKSAAVFVAWDGYDDACAAASAECVTVDPTVYIWKDKPKNDKRPKKVVWSVDPTDRYWKFTFKGESGKDYIGPVKDIKCGKSDTESKKASKDLEGDNLKWPYQIEVWSCMDNEPDKCLCKTDPEVIIKD